MQSHIKNFGDFINEDNKGLYSLVSDLFREILSVKPNADDEDETTVGVAGDPNIASDQTSTSYTPNIKANAVPGNDDFVLYMQHQQGVAGAKGIIQASLGTGKLNPDTIKTKKGVKYANLVGNIPSDRPQYKREIIAALDKGDQKTASLLFLNMWKEKWASKQKEAKVDIEKPQNAKVKEVITKYSQQYGIPFDFAITVANIESGFNPKTGNQTYKGLYAMIPSSSYGGIVTPMGSKWSDPSVNAENGMKLLKAQIKQLKSGLGKDWASLKVGSWANTV